MERFTLASARAAAEEGRTAGWVGDFLASPGSDNEILAAALATEKAAREAEETARQHESAARLAAGSAKPAESKVEEAASARA